MCKLEVSEIIPHSAPWITEGDIESVNSVLRLGMVAAGEKANEFAAKCSEYLGSEYSELTSSGQEALERALTLLGLAAGGSIVIPTYVCSSVEAAILRAGLRPLYCDIGDAWCMTADSVAKVLDSSVVAIVAVHLFGIKVDVESLSIFGVPIIEDCAQCFRSDVGRVGVAAIYSFHATKCLTAGEGGLVTISSRSGLNAALASESKSSHMSDVQASLGLSQLSRYETMLERRRYIADSYLSNISSIPLERIVRVEGASMYFRFPLFFSAGFDRVAPLFRDKGVMVRRGVDALLHRSRGLSDELFPNAVIAFDRTVSIPCYPALSDENVVRVIESVESVFHEL